jgi:hypothetical protein
MTSVLNVSSSEYANQASNPPVLANPSLNTSKLRIMPVTWAIGTAASIGSTGLLARMPQGKCTIWTGISKLYNSAWATTTTAAIGTGAYLTQVSANPPTTVAAATGAFRAAATLHTAGSFNLDTVDLSGQQTFFSHTGFDVTLTTAAEALGGTETLQGYIVYSVD